jgi:hypothetical protein
MLKVGDIVKSYDFPGNTECYMVGKVVGIHGDDSFRAQFVKRVWLNETDRKFKTDYFTAPLPGNYFGDDRFKRVVVVA